MLITPRLLFVTARLLAVTAVAWAAAPALAADRGECRGETPLPPGLRVIPPGPGVPAGAARFSGAWVGAWQDGARDALCQALVVEEILPGGYARVVYSHGTDAALGIRLPDFHRRTARIAGDALRFRVGWPGGSEFVYRVDGGGLASTYRGQYPGRLARAADVADIGCPDARRVPPVTPPAGPRDRLTAAELLGAAAALDRPVHTGYFAPVGAAGPPRHALAGTLHFGAGAIAHARADCTGLPSPAAAFSVQFFTHGEHLVPVARDVVPGVSLILSPGRVWSEPGDGGLTRAAFPFAVVDEVHNGLRNGLATFLYDDTRVSALRIQVSQETQFWERFDSWAQLPLGYAPGPVPATARAEFAAELARELPIRPWSDLPSAPALAAFDGDAAPPDISASGLVRDGVLYLRGCHTRHGPFPHCRHMRHGVFSVTKSLGAGIALFRLAQKYGDGVLAERITDHVPAWAVRPEWHGVTFAHALDMAVGVGDLARERPAVDPLADELGPKLFEFVGRRTRDEKLAIALSFGKYPWNPGAAFRYNSTHTFMLAVAMDAYLKRREGPDAHLWDMVRAEVFRPAGVLHAPAQHTVEAGGQRGVPVLGWGLWLTAEDAAKLAILLQDGGRHDGVQLLSPTAVAQALFRGNPGAGLPSGQGNRFGIGRYHRSFWSVPYRTASGCAFQIPYMAGMGGNLVALLPNGLTVMRFADGHHYDLDAMIAAGEALAPLCAPSAAPPSATPPSAAVTAAPLSADDVRALLSEHTMVTPRQQTFLAADGRLYGAAAGEVDVGAWHVTADGRYCRTWQHWDHGRARCYRVHRDGERLALHPEDRLGRLVVTRVPGNALGGE